MIDSAPPSCTTRAYVDCTLVHICWHHSALAVRYADMGIEKKEAVMLFHDLSLL